MPATDQQRMAQRRTKLHLSNGSRSDQVCVLRAVDGFHNITHRGNAHSSAAYRYCDDNFLSQSTLAYMTQLVQQLRGSIREVGIDAQLPFTQRFNGDIGLVMAVIGTGLYPDVGVRRQDATVYSTEKGCKTKVHQSSVVHTKGAAAGAKNAPAPPKRNAVECIGFQELIASAPELNSNFVRGASLQMLSTTPVSVFSVLVTCGVIREVERDEPGGDDSSSEEEEVVVAKGRGRNNGKAAAAAKVAKAAAEVERRSANKTAGLNEINVTIEVDGWLVLRVNAQHLELVHMARERLSAAIVEYVRDPAKPLPAVIARGVDKIAQALSIEQGRVTN